MLFVVVGFITLLASFLIALVILIREMSQRGNIEDAIGDYSLELADEVVNSEPSFSDQPVEMQQESIDPLDQDLSADSARLDEVVPFPWAMENDNQSRNREDEIKSQETVLASREPIQGENTVKLNSSFSLSDLVSKD